jgi:hypothetical protein
MEPSQVVFGRELSVAVLEGEVLVAVDGTTRDMGIYREVES